MVKVSTRVSIFTQIILLIGASTKCIMLSCQLYRLGVFDEVSFQEFLREIH
jgi:hypothetical protein